MKDISRSLAGAVVALCCASGSAWAAVTVTIINNNQPGVGFNDPTPVTPVGGNSGTTLGQQRLIAVQHAADIWGATLASNVPIRVTAAFVPLACSTNSAVLGMGGSTDIVSDFPNAPRPGTWYPLALASKLAGFDQAPPGFGHIDASFNSLVGTSPDCLRGIGFYLGLDNRPGNQIDIVPVVLHELAHGLGFLTYTVAADGSQTSGLPSIWDYFLLDNRTNKTWVEMTAAERVDSRVSPNGLSWNGPNVTAAVPAVLASQARVTISGRAAGDAAGSYEAGIAAFGPPLVGSGISGQLMPVVDRADGSGLACTKLSPLNALAVRNNIALVDGGGPCSYTVKAKTVQDAGAIAMVVANNLPGEVSDLPGNDPTIRIPSVLITQEAGLRLKAALQRRDRFRSGVTASLTIAPNRAGTDTANRILMYTPPVYRAGSSVSHYTTAARPDQLMEPFIGSSVTSAVTPPRDLTFPLLRDIGW